MRELEELADYLSGALTGAMGLRSPLGAILDRRGGPQVQGGDRVVEPDAGALRAARVARRVQGALALVGETDRAVLLAYYHHRPPSGLPSLGEHAGVATVIADTHRLLAVHEDRRVRGALRSGSAEAARAALEYEAPSGEMSDRLRALEALSGPERRDGRRTLRKLATASKRALEAAQAAYCAAYRCRRDLDRQERVQRLSAALEGQ